MKPARRLDFTLLLDAGDWSALGPPEPLVGQVAEALAAEVDLPAARCEVAVALSADAEVRELNRQWRRQDKPTNVLSFPSAPTAVSGDDVAAFLGDVILAYETVGREAADLGVPLEDHVRHLVLHGILHLLGFDHETDPDAERMEALETRILAGLGVADPYAGTEGGGTR